MRSLISKKLVTALLVAAMIMVVGGSVIAGGVQIRIISPFGGIIFGNPLPGFPPFPGSDPGFPPPPGGGPGPGEDSTPGSSGGPLSPPPSTSPRVNQGITLQTQPSWGVGSPVMYVNSYGQTVAGVFVGGNAALYVRGQGRIQVMEYMWTGWGWMYHDQAFRYNPGPGKWAPFWFFGDYVGTTPRGTWHALRARVGGVYTNWVYIFVFGG